MSTLMNIVERVAYECTSRYIYFLKWKGMMSISFFFVDIVLYVLIAVIVLCCS